MKIVWIHFGKKDYCRILMAIPVSLFIVAASFVVLTAFDWILFGHSTFTYASQAAGYIDVYTQGQMIPTSHNSLTAAGRFIQDIYSALDYLDKLRYYVMISGMFSCIGIVTVYKRLEALWFEIQEMDNS